jgi:hypothetical protein
VASLQKGGGVELAEYVDETGDNAGPACLMAGADAGAVIAMEVLLEQQIVPPGRVALEVLGSAKDRPAAVCIA